MSTQSVSNERLLTSKAAQFYELERLPTRDGHSPPSASAATATDTVLPAQKTDINFIPQPLMRNWMSVATILGCYTIAFASVLGHYLLFRILDGTLVDDGYLRQSRVSILSLLFITIFKAALTGAIGLAFAQHLWHVLRGNPSSISLVEKWFILRTNFFALMDIRIVYRAPLLFLMALFIWCLGIATITPPGALTIGLEPYSSTVNMNLSVMNPPIPQNFNPMLADEGRRYPSLSFLDRPEDLVKMHNTSYIGYQIRPGGQKSSLNLLVNYVITTGIFNPPVQPSENSTYQLEFRAPQYQCNSSQSTNTTTWDLLLSEDRVLAFESGYEEAAVAMKDLVFRVRSEHIVGAYSFYPWNGINNTDGALVERREMLCRPVTMRFVLTASYPNGVPTFKYSLDDPQPLAGYPEEGGTQYALGPNDPWPWSADRSDMALYPQDLQKWIQRVREILPFWNYATLIATLGDYLAYEWYVQPPLYLNSTYKYEHEYPQDYLPPVYRNGPIEPTPRTLENGTIVAFVSLPNDTADVKSNNREQARMRGSLFHVHRYDDASDIRNSSFDPRIDLNITQETLNGALANLTISALSLGTWWDMVPVTTTRYRSTYLFSNKLNLILPYSICLGVGVIFVIIGIWSLFQNGVAATDGGFLQVMLATRGDTEMERLAVKGPAVNGNNVSKELQALKIRYGELTIGDSPGSGEPRQWGFGTVEETTSLRKRK